MGNKVVDPEIPFEAHFVHSGDKDSTLDPTHINETTVIILTYKPKTSSRYIWRLECFEQGDEGE
jgi:hypothetical protein